MFIYHRPKCKTKVPDLDESQSSHAAMIFFQEILDTYFLKPSEITAGKCILDKTTEEK